MNDPEEYQLQFDVAFDGAYRYLDRCGEFMAAARQKFGFVPISVNPMGCNMEAPDMALQLQASGDALLLICTNLKFSSDLFRAADFCLRVSADLFDPFSIEHCRLVSRSIWRTATMEQSFVDSLKIFPAAVEDVGDLLQLPPLNQDLSFAYESGSRRLHLRLYPIAFNVTPIERKLPILGTPKGLREYLLKKEVSIRQNPAQPAYGFGLELTLVEIDPVLEEVVESLRSGLVDYRKKILNKLKQ